jgi:hypothetical protein
VVQCPIRPAGRADTVPLPRPASIGNVSAILDHPQVHDLRVGGRQPARVSAVEQPATLLGGGSVVALRQLRAIALGALAERGVLAGERLVTAHDAAGHSRWVTAEAVWSDATRSAHPEHPRPIGLATASTREAALVKGVSDRLGWEAVLEFERGTELPEASAVTGSSGTNAIVLDGRLGHHVPTVVVLGADTMRWGAGSTWNGAMRRALYGEDPGTDSASELGGLCDLLAADGLALASVDLGTPRLRAAGVVRCSVQIVAGDGSVRSWDAH